MGGEQLGAAEGGKLESMMEGEQLRLAKGGKRLQALWELRRGERERKLRLEADELESTEGEQIGAAEGEKRVRALWELRREERERKLRS